MKQLFKIFIIMIIASSSFAQGEYLGKGKSVVSGYFGMGFDNGEVGRSYFVAGSFKGVFDLGFGLSPSRFGDQQLTLSSNWHLKNERKGLNYTISASALYDDYGYFTIGPVIYSNQHISDHCKLQPFAGLGFIEISKKKTEDNLYLQYGMSLYWVTSNNTVFTLTPSAAKINGETNFSLTFGIMFSKSDKKKETSQFRIED